MPKLAELNGQVGFPVALYEAYDDMVAGVPGIQVPITLGTSSKLPVGLELDGPAGSDRKLLAIGMALDKLFGRLPPPPAH
jgi:Asp-tRNA(Asn)/Glu-tRNA(Gln) amidotransferase A subunit family amidase